MGADPTIAPTGTVDGQPVLSVAKDPVEEIQKKLERRVWKNKSVPLFSGKRRTVPTAPARRDPQEEQECCLDVAPRHEAGRPAELEAVPPGGAVNVQEIPDDMNIRHQTRLHGLEIHLSGGNATGQIRCTLCTQ